MWLTFANYSRIEAGVNHNTLKRLREALKERGWTQEAAALEAGVTQGHLNHVLHGKRHSRTLVRRLREIAKQSRKEVAA